MQEDKIIQKIAKKVKTAGGRAFVVGGSVRDKLLDIIPKDYDIEVYGLSADRLEKILESLGEVKTIGKAFSVFNLVIDKITFDISLPRVDSKVAPGHKGFAVKGDPDLDKRTACSRRDFTINAILEDPLTGQVYDYFGGRRDLRQKILRACNPDTFADDPLRALRAMQFMGRFNLSPDKKTRSVIKQMVPSLSELPPERIKEEFRNLLLKSERPSQGLDFAMKIGVFGALGLEEFESMPTTTQGQKHHPEGSVWNHTKLTVDAAALICRREELSDKQSWVVMLGAMLHDIGKPEVSRLTEKRSFGGHARLGMPLVKRFLKLLRVDKKSQTKIVKLIEDHEAPLWLYNDKEKGKDIKSAVIRKLARDIIPASIYELVLVSEADICGRRPYSEVQKWVAERKSSMHTWLLDWAKNLDVDTGQAKSLITGRDLIKLGYHSGPGFKSLIRYAENLRDQGLGRAEILKRLKNKP